MSVEKSAGAVQGVPVERVVLEQPEERTEILLAPTLGCQPMMSVTLRNGLTLKTEAVEDVRIGEPDPRLFEVPADWRWLN